ncbi:MAG: ATP synthase F1 subunit delta [Candidatus Limnocylindrales bacterium]
MARKRSSARRYAEAAFQIARRDDMVEPWLKDLDTAAVALSDTDATAFLANPAIAVSARQEVASRILGTDISPKALNLVQLLIRRGRSDLLPAVAREYRRLYDLQEGISVAVVTSAAPLGEAEVAAIDARLAQLVSGRVDITRKVDPSILGGVIVRIGDRLIDGSVRGRLERLRNRLTAGAL